MTEVHELLSDAALTTIRLNGQLLAVAEALARPVGLTAENPAHRVRAEALVAEMGADRLSAVLAGMHELSEALDRLAEGGASRRGAASTTAS